MKSQTLLKIAAVALLCSGRASAQGIVITIDEDGNGIGTVGPGFLANDPGPGGLPNVLTYNLPFNTVQGDVGLTDADVNGAALDYLRFNGNGTVIFYSDNVGGADSMADTPSPPGAFYPNRVFIPEVGPEGNNGAFYTPGPNDPGFAVTANGIPVTYHFISDFTPTAVPEPSALALLAGMGVCGAGLLRRRK